MEETPYAESKDNKLGKIFVTHNTIEHKFHKNIKSF